MVNTEIRLIIFFAAKDAEALYSQQNQDWKLTVAQIMNFLLPNSDWKKVEKNHGVVQVWTKSNPLWLYSGSDKQIQGIWTEVHDIVQEAGIKTIPEKKKCKKSKWLSDEALQIAGNESM